MKSKELTKEEKELIKKYENKQRMSHKLNKDKLEMYLEQTDRNYKDGDRN